MPGRKGTHQAPVAWNRAILLAGTEARLTAGVKEKTWRHWRDINEVPAYRLLPVLIERIEDELTDATHRCPFLDFTAIVGGYKYMRRTVLALALDDDERKKLEVIFSDAERIKKLETDPT